MHNLFDRLTTACGVLALVAFAGTVWAQSADRQFLDGLRARQLFGMAELTCQQQLADGGLTERQRAEWTAELVRTQSQYAANSAPASRAQHWLDAEKTTEQFLTGNADNPFRLLVEAQDAFSQLARGELARMESEVVDQAQTDLDPARSMIRQADRSLEQIDRQLTTLIDSSNGRPNLASLASHELISLQNHLRFQRARAYRNQALCYPVGSDDRSAALSQAVEQLDHAQTQVTASDPLLWKVYLEQAICYRLLASWPQAQLVLDSLTSTAAPVAMQSRAKAERVRLDLAIGRLDLALDELEKASQLVARSPELDFAALETYLACWQEAARKKDDAQSRQWQQQAVSAVTRLEREHGSYWARRGEMLLLRVAGQSSGDGNVAILAKTADSLFFKGHFDDAIRAYERAAQQATDAGESDIAFDLKFKAALVEQQEKRYESASRRLKELALKHTIHEKANQAHLLAAWNARQAIRDHGSAADPYAALLKEHLINWPDRATADAARMWLAQLYERRRVWKLAISNYRSIRPGSEHFPNGVEATGRVWRQSLLQMKDSGEPLLQEYQAAVAYFESLLYGTEKQWPDKWSAAQRRAAVAAARLRLSFPHEASTSGHQLAETARLLQTVLKASPDAPQPWRESAQALLVAALAGQVDNRDEALDLVGQLTGESPEQLLELVDRLSTLDGQATPDMRKELAQVQLAVLAHLETPGNTLSTSIRQRSETARAEALIAVGSLDKALKAYRALVLAYPNSGRVQIGLAQLLLDGTDAASWSAALDQWRRVAARLKPNSEDWYLAKYSIASAYLKLGKPTEAAKRLRYLKATSPVDLTRWKTRVDKLLADCR
jgi:hypothetical protein